MTSNPRNSRYWSASVSVRKRIISIVASGAIASGGVAFIAPTPAYAIYCSNCSTFYQQMFEYAEAVNTALNTAESLQAQIRQYQNMVVQGESPLVS